MPVSRLTAEGLAERAAAVYGDVEVRLLRLIAQHLEQGTDSPRWAELKLAELQVFRKRAERIASAAERTALQQVVVALRSAYIRGTAAGQGEADHLGLDIPKAPTHAEHAIEALVRAQQEQAHGLTLRVVRSAEDAYRAAVVRASAGTLTGASTRLQDAQQALDDLGRQGLSGFTDTAGRRWGLRSYAEMATRTVTAHAAVEGHMDRLGQAGINLFIVSDSPSECPLCLPWEGKVLSRGPVGALHRNALTGDMEAVPIDGTVEQATAAGLFHPNCTHSLSGYVHGATVRGMATHDRSGYADRQKQRGLERQVRAWKQRQAVAVTPEAKAKAAGKVRQWQAELAAHVDSTGLPRKRNRESLTAAR